MDSPLGKTRNVTYEDNTQVKHWYFNFTPILTPVFGKNGVAGSTPLLPRPRPLFFTPTPTGSKPRIFFFYPDPGRVMTPDYFFDPDPGGVMTPIIMINPDLSCVLAETPVGLSHFDTISSLNKC